MSGARIDPLAVYRCVQQFNHQGTEFEITFETPDAEMCDELRVAYPVVMTIAFRFDSVRDVDVNIGNESVEFYAAFIRMLGGERFLSVPFSSVVRLVQQGNAILDKPPAAAKPPAPFSVIRGGKA